MAACLLEVIDEFYRLRPLPPQPVHLAPGLTQTEIRLHDLIVGAASRAESLRAIQHPGHEGIQSITDAARQPFHMGKGFLHLVAGQFASSFLPAVLKGGHRSG